MILRSYFDNQIERGAFVKEALADLKDGSTILDAGAGSQQYRKFCNHLKYSSQDFGKVTKDEAAGFAGLSENYEYGPLDYICDITEIPINDSSFDAVLCTEVFEHIPDPISALKELSRVLKKDGILILTLPSNCLRHFDPYFFYSGFSDRWLTYWLDDLGFEIIKIKTEGNYFKWLALEMSRIVRRNLLSTPFILPAFIYLALRSINPSREAISTLCGGYYVIAKKTT